jgi:hypothetical protein
MVDKTFWKHRGAAGVIGRGCTAGCGGGTGRSISSGRDAYMHKVHTVITPKNIRYWITFLTHNFTAAAR